MRIIIILSLIFTCTITNAQDRKDTIRMKDDPAVGYNKKVPVDIIRSNKISII